MKNLRQISEWAFVALVFLALLTPFWVFTSVLFPFVTSKAFYFRIVVEAALPFYVFLILDKKSLRPNIFSKLNLAILAFLLINLLAGIVGVNPERSFWGNFERMGGVYYLAHLVVFAFYIQALSGLGTKYLKVFFQSFVAVAVVVSVNGLIGKLGWPTLTLDSSLPERVSSTLGNPIFLASYLVVPLFLALYLFLNSENRVAKVWYLTSVFLQFLGIYFSGTRGAMVGLVLAVFLSLVLYLFLEKNKKPKLYIGSVLGSLLLFGILLFFVQNSLPEGSVLKRLVKLRDSNSEARLIQWRMAIEGAKEKPLLGFGPENYYVVANSHYNPELYRYDASWFDKPHNYILEVLVTSGIFGLLAYVFMLVFSALALFRAYREELLSLPETLVFFAALATYQIQNLFVFDTVPSSVAFFVFLGFLAYLEKAAFGAEGLEKYKPEKIVSGNSGSAIIFSAFLLVSFYAIFVTNVQAYKAAKGINLGYAYTEYNPKKAAGFFQEAVDAPFNLDPRESANRFSAFAVTLSRQSPAPEKGFVLERLSKAEAFQQNQAEKVQNDPLLWLNLALVKMAQKTINGQNLDGAGLLEGSKALALAPNRVELMQFLVQYYGYEKNWPKTLEAAKKIVELNPYNPENQWQLALTYFLSGDTLSAITAGDRAVKDGFKFTSVRQFAWYISYYKEQKNYKKTAELLEIAVQLETQDTGLFAELAYAYAGLGDKDKAEAIARQVELSDPGRKAEMEALIKSLQK